MPAIERSHPRHRGAMAMRSQIMKESVAVVLSLVAGQIDVVGFLACWHVFTAHMTGNSVHLAMSLVAGHWGDAVRAGAVIPIFLLGSVVGRSIIEFCVRRRFRRSASIVLLLEAAILCEVIALRSGVSGNSVLWFTLLLLALCMGLQTAALTRVGPLTVHTTFVTGMLNSLAQRLSLLFFWMVDRLRGKASNSWTHSKALGQAALLAAVFVSYVCGALLATRLAQYSPLRSLFLTIGLIFCCVCIDQITPLSIEEEEDEAKLEQEEHRRRLAG